MSDDGGGGKLRREPPPKREGKKRGIKVGAAVRTEELPMDTRGKAEGNTFG